MRKILVTGANGFLGQAISRHFREQGWTVRGLARRLVNDIPCPLELTSYAVSDLSRIIGDYRPDVVFHEERPYDKPDRKRDSRHARLRHDTWIQHYLRKYWRNQGSIAKGR